MTYLSRESILDADDLSYDDVDVPEWGGTVRVRALTGAERDRFEASIAGGKKPSYDNFRSKLVVASVVDADGERLFTQADVQLLGKKSAAALNRVFEAAQRLSGLNDEDVDELTGE